MLFQIAEKVAVLRYHLCCGHSRAALKAVSVFPETALVRRKIYSGFYARLKSVIPQRAVHFLDFLRVLLPGINNIKFNVIIIENGLSYPAVGHCGLCQCKRHKHALLAKSKLVIIRIENKVYVLEVVYRVGKN